tara:strand:+ start:462 stop:1046 length:585 start_codon:yes stop_codon:yes gene_type:complete
MSIVKMETSDSSIIMNIDELKVMKGLEGATVFKTLLSINDDSKFKKVEINTKLFNELNISSNDWTTLYSFLKNGYPPYYLEYNRKSELFTLLLDTIENINRTNNTLGGIPSFDRFYQQFYEMNKLNLIEKYNPKNPNEDYNNKYNWLLDDSEGYGTNMMQVKYEFNRFLLEGFNPISVSNVGNGIFHKWYRKAK